MSVIEATLASREVSLAEAALRGPPRVFSLLTSLSGVIWQRFAANTKVVPARLAAEAVVLHVLGLSLCERLPVGSKPRELLFPAMVHALEHVATCHVRAADEVAVAFHELHHDCFRCLLHLTCRNPCQRSDF